MQKNKSVWNVKTLVFMALLVALHLILTRVFVIDLGAYRISLGSIATILAGLWLGPASGAACGFVADVLGCFMKGYAVNLFITLAAVCWGMIPGLARVFFENKTRKAKTAGVSITIVFTGILSSLVLTTTGLVLIGGYNFYAIIPGRFVQAAIMLPIYCVVTCLLYLSPLTGMVMGTVRPAAFKKKVV